MRGRSIGSEKTAGGGGEFEIERPGARIGDRYEVLALIGEGGMGAVYRCRDLKLEREVAVKRLSAGGAGARAGLERFQREAKAVASLNHRNIVVVHEYGDDARGPYIVMELLAGRDLATLVAESGALPVAEVKGIARQVCAALTYAHRKRVVHRDIKPSNLFRLADGSVKVLDFGLARVGTESQLSIEGFGLGTLDYVSPEQRRDASRVDHASDLFSLGVTLYFLATGKSPRTIKESDIPAELREALLKLMEERPADRYFSVDEAAAALARGPSAGARAKAAERPVDACPACGHVSAPETRFCEACGAGLFEKCPACGTDGRAGRTYCGKCGANTSDYRRAQEHASRAAELEQARAWARAEKEWAGALEARPDWKDAKTGVERARASQQQMQSAQQRCRKAVEAKDLAAARAALAELEKLAPRDDPAFIALRDQGVAPLAKRRAELEAAQKEADERLRAGDWDACDAALTTALALSPGDLATQRIAGRLAERRAEYERLLESACSALAARDPASAEEWAAKLEQINGSDRRTASLRADIAGMREVTKRVDALVAEANRALDEGDWALAAAKLEAAAAQWPHGGRIAEARARLEARRAELAAHLEEAQRALDARELDVAESSIERASAIRCASAELDGLRDRLEAMRAEHARAETAMAEGEKQMGLGRFDEAALSADAAEAAWPGHEGAAELRERALKSHQELEDALRAAAGHIEMRRLSKAREALALARHLAPSDARVADLTARLARQRGQRSRRLVLGVAGAVALVVAVALVREWSARADQRSRLAESDHRADVSIANAKERYAARQLAEAKAWAQTALEHRPGDGDAAALQARIAEDEAALATAKRSVEELLAKGDVANAKKRLGDARALDAGDRTLDALSKRIDDRAQAEDYAKAARSYLASGKLGEAENSLAKAEALVPGLPIGADVRRARTDYAQAVADAKCLLDALDLVQADVAIARAVAIDGAGQELSDLRTRREAKAMERQQVDRLGQEIDALIAAKDLAGAEPKVADLRKIAPGHRAIVAYDAAKQGPAASSTTAPTDASPAAASPRAGADGYYVVQVGDTLATIAQKVFGSSKKWKYIFDANRSLVRDDPNRLRLGMRLRIPRIEGEPYDTRELKAGSKPEVTDWADVLARNPDPDVVTNADWRARIQATGLPWRVKDKSSGIELLLVPPGEFDMRASPGDGEAQGNEPRHRVKISGAFYLGRYEVTQAEWRKAMGINRSTKGDRHPVENVSWDDISQPSGFLERAGIQLRLPTEAEWEYACRAGTSEPRYASLDAIAWFGGNAGGSTHEVGGKLDNALGFFDMLGNVWEWCSDWYGDYDGSQTAAVDPRGPASGQFRVLRGGSWNNVAGYCRASNRYGNAPELRSGSIGFRVARTP